MSPKIRIGLSKKLVFLVMSVSLVAVGISAYLSFTYGVEVLKQKTGDQLLGESTTRGNSLRNLFDARIKQIQIIATDPMVQVLVEKLNTSEDEYQTRIDESRRDFLIEIQAFQELVGYSIGFEDVKILGKNGQAYFSLAKLPSEDFSQDPYFVSGLKNSFIDFEPVAEGQKRMIVVTPIFAKDDNHHLEPIGVVIAKMRTKTMDDILLNRSGLGKSGEVYVVNSDYILISESRFLKNTEFNQKVDIPPVRKCFEEEKELLDFYQDYRGVKIFGSSYCAKDLGFVLLAEIDESETIEPILILQDRIFLTGLVITIVMGVITFFLSKSISYPLVKLQKAAQEIEKGNFDVRTNIKTSDEIGQLSTSFDSMAKRLQEAAMAINLREEIIKEQEDMLLQFSKHNEDCCVCMIDIIQSTMLASELDGEKTRKFYSIFINSIAEIVKSFNGIVVKNIGDAVLFYFTGIKPSDSKSFLNAIDCCLTICNSNEKISANLQKESLPAITYRVSMTYGTVSLAQVSTSSVKDIFGSTVNRCAKINRFALPNTLVIGSDVHENVKTTKYNFKNMNVNPTGTNQIYTVYLVSRS
ncbi:MAG: HAMP domain-containing protein [Thaumarchaeota archaeon]|nr:HAMP domain-containing protein [Nitrososphaerota archaeon]